MKQVVCALIVNESRLLIVQHGIHSGHPFMWEFPGGKILPGEPTEIALKREVMEEISILISVESALKPILYKYPGKEIYLMPYLCHWFAGEIQLNEHYDYRWIDPKNIFDYDMLPADFEMLNSDNNLDRVLAFCKPQTGTFFNMTAHKPSPL